jgi:hypothetical protein
MYIFTYMNCLYVMILPCILVPELLAKYDIATRSYMFIYL